MKITRRQLRRIIREELVKEGFIETLGTIVKAGTTASKAISTGGKFIDGVQTGGSMINDIQAGGDSAKSDTDVAISGALSEDEEEEEDKTKEKLKILVKEYLSLRRDF